MNRRSLTEIQKQFSGRKGSIYFSWLDQKPRELEENVKLQLSFDTMSIMLAPNRVLLSNNTGNVMVFENVEHIDVEDGIVPNSKYFTIVCNSDTRKKKKYHILADYD